MIKNINLSTTNHVINNMLPVCEYLFLCNCKKNEINPTISLTFKEAFIIMLVNAEVHQMKRPFQPNTRKAKKDHGFFARKEGKGNILGKRRKKGRKKLSK